MTSADGPSRAGPISDRVVKPEALVGVSDVLEDCGWLEDAPAT